MQNIAKNITLKTTGQIKFPSTWMPHCLPIKQIYSSKCAHQRAEHGEKIGGPARWVYFEGTKRGKRRLARVVLAISHGKGIIAREPYERMHGAYFADFIDRNFNCTFEEMNKEEVRIFMQDSNPSQNSAIAKRAMLQKRCTVIHYPVCSPDIHVTENAFNITNSMLKEAAKLKR